MLINNGKRAKTIAVPLAGSQTESGAIGVNPDHRYHAFEFWTQTYLGCLQGNEVLSVRLKGGEVAMVSLRQLDDHPQVISTNRHIMQGMMECHDIKWSATDHTLRGSVDVVEGDSVTLTVACNGFKAIACQGAEICHVKQPDLIQLCFASETNSRINFKLTFSA
jgi:hypothetical protein